MYAVDMPHVMHIVKHIVLISPVLLVVCGHIYGGILPRPQVLQRKFSTVSYYLLVTFNLFLLW